MKYDFEAMKGRHVEINIPSIQHCIADCTRISGLFWWSETPQDWSFWSSYNTGGNQTEGKAALREMIAQLEAEQSTDGEWGDWVEHDGSRGFPDLCKDVKSKDIQTTSLDRVWGNGWLTITHYRIRKNAKRVAPDFNINLTVDTTNESPIVKSGHYHNHNQESIILIRNNGKYSVEVVE